MATLIADKYEAFKAETNARWDQLKANEEELNRIFAEIYGMVGEVPIEVEDKYVSVARVFDTAEEIPESFKGNKYVLTKRDEIVSLISYAVGCMFGRYSLDVEGLVLADAGQTLDDYRAKMPDPERITFLPDADNILPITDDEYFSDEIVGRFVEFVRAAYGDETLEENLRFVSDALGGKGTPREVIRAYFLKEFFKDHCQTYKKRPIYWLFDSGKKNGSRRSSTCTATGPTCWRGCVPTTCTSSRSATARASGICARSGRTRPRAAVPRSTSSSRSWKPGGNSRRSTRRPAFHKGACLSFSIK